MAYYVKRNGASKDISYLIQSLGHGRVAGTLPTYMIGGSGVSGAAYNADYHKGWQGNASDMINGDGHTQEYGIGGSYITNLGFCQAGFYPTCKYSPDMLGATQLYRLGGYVHPSLWVPGWRFFRIAKTDNSHWRLYKADVPILSQFSGWIADSDEYNVGTTGSILIIGLTASGGPGFDAESDSVGGRGGQSGTSGFFRVNLDNLNTGEGINIRLNTAITYDIYSADTSNLQNSGLLDSAIYFPSGGAISDFNAKTPFAVFPAGAISNFVSRFATLSEDSSDAIQEFTPWYKKLINYNYGVTVSSLVGGHYSSSSGASITSQLAGRSYYESSFYGPSGATADLIRYQVAPGDTQNRYNSIPIAEPTEGHSSQESGGSGGSSYFGSGGVGGAPGQYLPITPKGTYYKDAYDVYQIASENTEILAAHAGGGGGGAPAENSSALASSGAGGYPSAFFIWGW